MPEPTTLGLSLRPLAAAGLGAALGLERELNAQPAGFRTHLLVSLGSALFTAAGAQGGDADPARVAAQVVTGIGFLGAGAILCDRYAASSRSAAVGWSSCAWTTAPT